MVVKRRASIQLIYHDSRHTVLRYLPAVCITIFPFIISSTFSNFSNACFSNFELCPCWLIVSFQHFKEPAAIAVGVAGATADVDSQVVGQMICCASKGIVPLDKCF